MVAAAFSAVSAAEYKFPDDASIIDVKRDFGAKGDGVTDDTAAIQQAVVKAISGNYRNPKFIYFPNGTYVISNSIKSRVKDVPDGQGGWSDGWRCGMIFIGQDRAKTIIRLKDSSPGFGDKSKPRAMLIWGSTNHSGAAGQNRKGGWGNEGFQNYFNNFTVETGKGNQGAIAVDFLASNRGTMEDITIRSGEDDKSGYCGLDLTRPWPGPALIRNVLIEGFDYGIRQDGMDCSMAFEHITLTGQKVAAIWGAGSPFMSLRKVVSNNAVPAFDITGDNAIVSILDSSFTFTGTGQAPPAIKADGYLLLKNVDLAGYQTLLASPDKAKKKADPVKADADAAGKAAVKFYMSRKGLRLHEGAMDVPYLPVKETPTYNDPDLTKWANARKFAAGSATAGIQEAIDSGVQTVYLPNGDYAISRTVVIRGKVRRILGMEATINVPKDMPAFRFDGGEADTVVIEHISGGLVEHNCDKTLSIRKCSVGYRNTARGTGDAFLEDGMFHHPTILYPQSLWARQPNSEFGSTPNFTNTLGKAWILGYKVEGWVSAILNVGGVTECYSLYSMTGNGGDPKKAPFVENREGWLAVPFRDGGQGNHFTKFKDTWEGVTKQEDNWKREYAMVVGGQKFDPSRDKPGAPGPAAAKATGPGTVELTWGAAQSKPIALLGYNVSRNGQLVVRVPADKTSFTDTGLTESTQYAYEVAAINERGGVSDAVKASAGTPADTTAPTIARFYAPGEPNVLVVEFSKPMDAAAGVAASYKLSPEAAIAKVKLSFDGDRAIIETTSPLVDGTSYTLTCTGLKDRSKAGNALAPGTADTTFWLRGAALTAEFWNNLNFEGKPVLTLTERKVDHWWGEEGSPGAEVTPKKFCGRWSGVLRPRVSGEYAFNTGARTGCRVIIDGKTVHDAWTTKSEWTWSKPVPLEAGKRYSLVFEMYADGAAGARLKWKGPGFNEARFLDDEVLVEK
jgi:hypothetical protein